MLEKEQLTTEQRVFIVTHYYETGSVDEVRRRFEEQYPAENLPSRSTVILHKTLPAVILNVRIETKSRDYNIDPFQSIVAAIREVYQQW